MAEYGEWYKTPAGTSVATEELFAFANDNGMQQQTNEPTLGEYLKRIAEAYDKSKIEDDEDEEDLDDIADDVFSALSDVMPRKRIPNGEYAMAVRDVRFTEMPSSEGPSYATFTLVVSRGRYRGKVVSLRVNAV